MEGASDWVGKLAGMQFDESELVTARMSTERRVDIRVAHACAHRLGTCGLDIMTSFRLSIRTSM